jgi:hypothetical protein
MSSVDHEDLREALKRVAVALKESGVPFALAGSYAGWARGGPEPAHDVDFMVSAEDAERAAEALGDGGLEVIRPPEDWLFKVRTDGVVVDVLHRTADRSAPDLDDVPEMPVLSVVMPVLPATDVLSEKLVALDEHYCDVAQVLPVARALREQVDWSVVRRRSQGQPFAEAVLFLLERLEVIDPAS